MTWGRSSFPNASTTGKDSLVVFRISGGLRSGKTNSEPEGIYWFARNGDINNRPVAFLEESPPRSL
jgi:hypothetical protein